MKFLYIIVILSTNILYTFGSDEEDVDEEVQNWLDRIDEFGKDWEKKTDETQPEFTNEWKETVEKELEEIREVVEDMKSKGGSLATEAGSENTKDKSWMTIIKEKLESIQKFGISWKNKISKKFRLKFKRDWAKHVEKSINKLKEVDTTAPSKVKSMWDKIKNYGKDTFGGNVLEKLKMTRTFPLPLDLEGVKVKYHKSKICVTQKGKEKCASKNEIPGQNAEVEKLFRVVHEYEKLNERDGGGGGGSDDGGGDGDDGGDGGDRGDKSDKDDKGDKDEGGVKDDGGDREDDGDGSDGNDGAEHDGKSNEYKKYDKSEVEEDK